MDLVIDQEFIKMQDFIEMRDILWNTTICLENVINCIRKLKEYLTVINNNIYENKDVFLSIFKCIKDKVTKDRIKYHYERLGFIIFIEKVVLFLLEKFDIILKKKGIKCIIKDASEKDNNDMIDLLDILRENIANYIGIRQDKIILDF